MPVVHIVIYVGLILAGLAVGTLAARRRWARWPGVLLGVAVLVAGIHVVRRPDHLARLLPYPWIAWYANLYPIGVAVMTPAIIAIGHTWTLRLRLAALTAVLITVSLLPMRIYLAAPSRPEPVGANWIGEVRQTTDESCSAAAMVSLLHRYGIRTTEREIAELALTGRDTGTIALGRYRAMKIMAEQTGRWEVDFRVTTVDQLLRENRPAVISVGIGRYWLSAMEERLCREANWSPGRAHSVVFVGRIPGDPNHVIVMDPDAGYEAWPVEDLRTLFQGELIRLIGKR